MFPDMASFSISLDTPSLLPVDVSFETSACEYDALENTDYYLTSSGTIHFSPGVTELTVFAIPIDDDLTEEQPERIHLSLLASDEYNISEGYEDASADLEDDDNLLMKVNVLEPEAFEPTEDAAGQKATFRV